MTRANGNRERRLRLNGRRQTYRVALVSNSEQSIAGLELSDLDWAALISLPFVRHTLVVVSSVSESRTNPFLVFECGRL